MDFLRVILVMFYLLQSFTCYAKVCSEEINSTVGVVQSPEYPSLYPNNLRCTWRITVKETFIVRLAFTYFHLQQRKDGVCKDKLQIYDGGDRSIFNKCGGPFNNTLEPVFSSGNQLRVKFTTDGSNSKSGFSASFTSVPLMEEINSTEGVVQSLNYPSGYPNNLRCTWRITVRETFTVRLVFTDFNLEQRRHGDCKDKLQIYDGGDDNSPVIWTKCGRPSYTINPISSSRHELFLKLTTDGSNQGKGFSANFTSVPPMGSSITKTIISKTNTISTSVTARATTSTKATTAELFHSSLLPDELTTCPVLTTASPFDAFSSSTESTTQLRLVSKFLRNSAPALYAVVPSMLLVLCLLAFGLFVILKKSMKESLSSTTDHSNHSATTTNQGANVAQLPEFMVEDGRIERCNTIPLSECVTMTRDGEENGKDESNKSRHGEGEILNIVYESYGNEVNEAGDLRGEDGGVGKSDLTCHEDGGAAKQDTIYAEVDDKDSDDIVCDDICPEREKGFEINIIYEPFDRDG